MCNFASFVLTKEREFWLDSSDSHEEIINHFKLHADGAAGPNIIRVELTPPREGDWGDLSTWNFRIDQDIKPNWADTAEPRTRAAAVHRFKNGYTVGRDLNLNGCTGLKALPTNLTVGGFLDLYGCTGLKALPANLKVGGSLYLDGCTGLKALPANLKVGRDLDLYGCTGLKALPTNLKVGGGLYLPGHLKGKNV